MGLDFGESLDTLWLRVILSTMNGVTVVITLLNLYQLRKDFLRLGLMAVSDGRRLMRPFFICMTILPVFISGIGHYGAQYPSVAAWLFPGVSIVMALGFLWFISLMYIACGSTENVRRHLIHQDDRCGFPNMENNPCCREKSCFMSNQNAWLGLRKRRFWLYLVFVKPLLTYFQTCMVFFVNHQFASTVAGNLLRVSVLVCTFGPVQGLRCFSAAMLPLCRMERARSKVLLMQVLVPMLQIEMTLIDFLVTNKLIHSIGDLNAKHRGYRWMGLLYCVQMMFVAVVTGYVYQASDLINWKERQGFQWSFHVDSQAMPTNAGKTSTSLTEAAAGNQSLSSASMGYPSLKAKDHYSAYDSFTDTMLAREQRAVQSGEGVVVDDDENNEEEKQGRISGMAHLDHEVVSTAKGDANDVPSSAMVTTSNVSRLRTMVSSRGRLFQRQRVANDERSELTSELSDLSETMSARLLENHQTGGGGTGSHLLKSD